MYLTKMWANLIEGWQVKLIGTMIFTKLFGECNAGMVALFILIVLDWLTKWWVLSKQAGSFKIAWETNIISSRGMRGGLPKIFWYLVLLIAANQLNNFSFLGHTLGGAPKEVISAYLALIESKSILENLRDTGMTGLEPFIAMLGRKHDQITGKKDE